jgi:hypothetical protein
MTPCQLSFSELCYGLEEHFWSLKAVGGTGILAYRALNTVILNKTTSIKQKNNLTWLQTNKHIVGRRY